MLYIFSVGMKLKSQLWFTCMGSGNLIRAGNILKLPVRLSRIKCKKLLPIDTTMLYFYISIMKYVIWVPLHNIVMGYA